MMLRTELQKGEKKAKRNPCRGDTPPEQTDQTESTQLGNIVIA